MTATASIRKFTTTTAVVLVLSGPVWAADFEEKFEGTKPAVSGFNGKLDIGYFHYDIDGLPGSLNGGYAIGSFSVPVGHSFGLQVDAGFGSLDWSALPGFDITLGGAGLHAFWRDPDRALVGIYAHYVNVDFGPIDFKTFRYGIEGELYLDRFTIEAFVGGDTVNGPFGIGETFFNAQLIGAYYVTDNFRLNAGVVHQFDDTFGLIGGEAMLPFGANMASLYANGLIGGDQTTVRAGLRLYFGESGKSLIARHREDDPYSKLLDYFGIKGINKLIPTGGGGEEGGGSEEGGCYPYC